jgi:hypothetical protein
MLCLEKTKTTNNVPNNSHAYCHTISETVRFKHVTNFTNPTDKQVSLKGPSFARAKSKNDKYAGYERSREYTQTYGQKVSTEEITQYS